MTRRGRLFGSVILAVLLSPGPSVSEPHRFATVPALAVGMSGGVEVGSLHYIVIQLDYDPQGRGPTIQFSEHSRGSAVGDEWKEGVRVATMAAAQAVNLNPKNWTVTIKNFAYASNTNGASASSAIAVGLMAAWRGEVIRPDTVLTGLITSDGRIQPVDSLPSKLDGAARSHMHVMLIPTGQARTDEWDLVELGQQRNIIVIEVATLANAYELMAGQRDR
jgi:hypothetical protein